MTPEHTRCFAVLWLFGNQVVKVNIITEFSQKIALPSKKTQIFFSSWAQECFFGPRFVTIQTCCFVAYLFAHVERAKYFNQLLFRQAKIHY